MVDIPEIMKGCAVKCNLIPDMNLKRTVEEFGFAKIAMQTEGFQNAGLGGPEMEFQTGGMDMLNCTFKLLGMHRELYRAFSKPGEWTFTGAVENERTGELHEYEVEISGRLATIEQNSRTRASLSSHNYELKGIFRYRVVEDGKQIFLFDYYQDILAFGDDNTLDPINAILG